MYFGRHFNDSDHYATFPVKNYGTKQTLESKKVLGFFTIIFELFYVAYV